MDQYENEITTILKRNELKTQISNMILSYKSDENVKKNIFVYGDCGVGKTSFAKNIIRDLNCDLLLYNNIDVRNKATMENISNGNISNRNVIHLFNKIKKQIVIVMDDVETINNGDKSALNMLIKIVRPKKTKKQKMEEFSTNQIICISSNITDKKIKELSNACFVFCIPPPTRMQMGAIIQLLMPDKSEYHSEILQLVNCNLKKMETLYDLYLKDKRLISRDYFLNIRESYSNDESKLCTKNIINGCYNDNFVLSETDRNIIGLLWHENIVDILSKLPKEKSIPLYISFMKNICFADYIDKFIFQKQIWQLNELCFTIKVFKNVELYKAFLQTNPNNIKITDVRFTKILTKYSTEYNNYIFIRELCQSLLIDSTDIYSYFYSLKEKYTMDEINVLMEQYDISPISVNRIYKFFDKIKNGEEE